MKALRSWLFFSFLCFASLFVAVWLRGGTDATLFAVVESWLRAARESLPAPEDEAYKPAAPPEHVVTGNKPGTVSTPRPVAPNHASAVASEHSSDDAQVCGRPRTKSRSATDQQVFYKWVDGNGQTHMADQRPQGYVASVMDMGMTKRDFTYEIIPDGVSVPLDFPGQLSAGSKRIYDTWHFFLGEEKLRQSKINLKLIGGPDRFNAYYAKESPGKKPVNGFYSMGKNMAVVKFDPAHLNQTLATSFHETSHLITAGHLGPTPPWLTEGLAGEF